MKSNMIREFDDEYLKDLIEDKKLENLEENKEEIDIWVLMMKYYQVLI